MKIASIDIGTNTLLLLIATQDSNGKITPLLEKHEITRLGQGMDEHQTLSALAMERTLKVLAQFTDLCHRNEVSRIFCIGTEALRRAKNSGEFVEAIRKHCGFHVDIIPGTKEAELAYLSAAVDFQHESSHLVVLDIGGGSTELIWQIPTERGKGHLQAISMKMGSVRLTEKHIRQDPISNLEYQALTENIETILSNSIAPAQLPKSPFYLIGVAGTATTLSSIDQKLITYDSKKIQGAILKRSSLEKIIRDLRQKNLQERKQMMGMEPERADVLLAGACILEAVLKRLKAEEVIVSDRGIRYGVLYEKFLETPA